MIPTHLSGCRVELHPDDGADAETGGDRQDDEKDPGDADAGLRANPVAEAQQRQEGIDQLAASNANNKSISSPSTLSQKSTSRYRKLIKIYVSVPVIFETDGDF